MRRITIGDMDYYYAKDKRNIFNPNAMKIASYHKQLGDQINFVETQDDIRRPYDVYYIIKEDKKTPNPPYDFYLNSKVKWWGKAVERQVNGKMDNVMLACRPDYLLYPNKDTTLERAEHLRLLNNKGQLLPIIQEGDNSFKNKRVLETDTTLWTTSAENCKVVLKRLAEIKNLTFLEPIWIPKLTSDKEIEELFLELNLVGGSNLQGIPVYIEDFAEAERIVEKIKNNFPRAGVGPIIIKLKWYEHGDDKTYAMRDFSALKDIIVRTKQKKIRVELKEFKSRLDTPYFFLFETIGAWLKSMPTKSWLDYITNIYGCGLKKGESKYYGMHKELWSEPFRDLLRQTWMLGEFLTLQGGDKYISENDIPWEYGKKEFELGL